MSETRGAIKYEITLGGTTMKQTEKDALQMAVVEDHVDMVSMCTVRVGGAEGQPSWNFKIGDEVEVKLDGESIFQGEITSMEPGFQIEGTSSMTVRAMDKTHRLGRGRKTRFWEEMKTPTWPARSARSRG